MCHGILTSSLFHQNDLFVKQTIFLAALNFATNMKLNEVKPLEQISYGESVTCMNDQANLEEASKKC